MATSHTLATSLDSKQKEKLNKFRSDFLVEAATSLAWIMPDASEDERKEKIKKSFPFIWSKSFEFFFPLISTEMTWESIILVQFPTFSFKSLFDSYILINRTRYYVALSVVGNLECYVSLESKTPRYIISIDVKNSTISLDSIKYYSDTLDRLFIPTVPIQSLQWLEQKPPNEENDSSKSYGISLVRRT